MNRRQLENIADGVIQRTLRRLPERLRQEVEACRIGMEWMCDTTDEPGLDGDLLGLFEGASRGGEGPGGLEDLPRIRLFLDNLWEHGGRHAQGFREEVRITLLHEIGHYLGLDEDQVAALGLA